MFQLSLANNHIVDIKGVSAATGLKVLDLSNNSIVSIEGILSLLLYYWLLFCKCCLLASLDMAWSCAPFFGSYSLLPLTTLILQAFIWEKAKELFVIECSFTIDIYSHRKSWCVPWTVLMYQYFRIYIFLSMFWRYQWVNKSWMVKSFWEQHWGKLMQISWYSSLTIIYKQTDTSNFWKPTFSNNNSHIFSLFSIAAENRKPW